MKLEFKKGALVRFTASAYIDNSSIRILHKKNSGSMMKLLGLYVRKRGTTSLLHEIYVMEAGRCFAFFPDEFELVSE